MKHGARHGCAVGPCGGVKPGGSTWIMVSMTRRVDCRDCRGQCQDRPAPSSHGQAAYRALRRRSRSSPSCRQCRARGDGRPALSVTVVEAEIVPACRFLRTAMPTAMGQTFPVKSELVTKSRGGSTRRPPLPALRVYYCPSADQTDRSPADRYRKGFQRSERHRRIWRAYRTS